MKFVCLGWGSLVWSPGVLRTVGDWHADGPELPLEFARTSQDGRLTLVLVAGAPLVPCLWSELDYTAPHHAQEALAGREGCTLTGIGLWPGAAPAHGAGAERIARWAQERSLQAVVWTALPPKFGGAEGRAPASAEASVAYLLRLEARAQDPEITVEKSIDRADKALYAAKSAGRNCVRLWDASM